MDNVLIIIPTYNEKNNIVRLINNLLELEVNILIVDDNSPDNTAKEVNKIFKDFKKVHLLIRQKKLGLGSAYRDGFKWGLENNFDYLLEMDADFSHRINDLKKLISEKNNADLIIGSRYIRYGKILGWSRRRRLLSVYANKFASYITNSKVKDMTSGFRVYSRKALEKIDFSNTENNGYAFQIEMTVLTINENLDIKEVPITFVEREKGKSKMSYKIVLEALKYLLLFKLKN